MPKPKRERRKLPAPGSLHPSSFIPHPSSPPATLATAPVDKLTQLLDLAEAKRLENILAKIASGKNPTQAEANFLAAKRASIASTSPHSPLSASAAPTPYAQNYVELATLLGTTRRSLQTWRTLPGAPAPLPNGQHDIAAWQIFIEENGLRTDPGSVLSPQSSALTPLRSEEEALRIRAVRQILEFKLACMREEWIRADVGKADIARAYLAFTTQLLKLPSVEATHVVGLTVPEAEKRLRTAIHDALRELSQGQWPDIPCPHCGKSLIVEL